MVLVQVRLLSLPRRLCHGRLWGHSQGTNPSKERVCRYRSCRQSRSPLSPPCRAPISSKQKKAPAPMGTQRSLGSQPTTQSIVFSGSMPSLPMVGPRAVRFQTPSGPVHKKSVPHLNYSLTHQQIRLLSIYQYTSDPPQHTAQISTHVPVESGNRERSE